MVPENQNEVGHMQGTDLLSVVFLKMVKKKISFGKKFLPFDLFQELFHNLVLFLGFGKLLSLIFTYGY